MSTTATAPSAHVLVFGVTPPYQIVQDYRFEAGDPLSEPDVQRAAPGRGARLRCGRQALRSCRRGRWAGRSGWRAGRSWSRASSPGKAGCWASRSTASSCCRFSTFESMYGRRKTTVVSVKMDNADAIPGAMAPGRGGDADRPSAPPRRGRRLHRGQGRRPGGVLAEPDPAPLHRHSRGGLHRYRGRWHRDHEHHADDA